MTDSGVLTCACAGDKIGTITPSHSTIPKRTSLQRRIELARSLPYKSRRVALSNK